MLLSKVWESCRRLVQQKTSGHLESITANLVHVDLKCTVCTTYQWNMTKWTNDKWILPLIPTNSFAFTSVTLILLWSSSYLFTLALSCLPSLCAHRSTVLMTRVCWWGSGESFQVGFIQDCGSAAGTFCASGQKVALSATASVGFLLLLRAQVWAQCSAWESFYQNAKFRI